MSEQMKVYINATCDTCLHVDSMEGDDKIKYTNTPNKETPIKSDGNIGRSIPISRECEHSSSCVSQSSIPLRGKLGHKIINLSSLNSDKIKTYTQPYMERFNSTRPKK